MWGRKWPIIRLRVDRDKLEVRHGDDDGDGELCQIGRPPEVAQRVQHANIEGIFSSLCICCFLIIKMVQTYYSKLGFGALETPN